MTITDYTQDSCRDLKFLDKIISIISLNRSNGAVAFKVVVS